MINHPYAKWFDGVRNPSQYIGNEVHSVIKDSSKVDCRVALCFPEIYKIGMSHLGLKILYSILNRHPRLWAERFFVPEPDFEATLRNEKEPLRSLESHDPLTGFDIVGFSISTELCFTGILTILDLGGLALKSCDRREGDPLVIGGGASVYNPEPVADFFDLFVLGEAEEVLPELALKTAEYKKEGIQREELLRRLAKLKGIYVPSLYSVTYKGAAIDKITPAEPGMPAPSRQFIKDLKDSPFPYDMVIPYGQPVFDRLSVEIDRGCTGGCRFCQAGITYRPVRERDPKTVMGIIDKSLKATGFDEVSLASLSSGDYGNIELLVTRLMDSTATDHISVSLPSLRSGTLTEELIRQVARARKTGFTITAEAGTERLRNVINKKISDEEILETASRVLAGGWRNLKLYFMIGLPTETDEDIEAIIRMVEKICSLKNNGRRFMKINVGVSQFVPKSHTPFQWVAMDSPEELLRKKKMILTAFKWMKRANMKGHEVEMSYIEAVFSRGDRRLGDVILRAYEKGCRLDGWSEHFRHDLWLEAFKEAGLDPNSFALRERERDEILPWDHLDIGVSKKYLLREFKHAGKGEVTNDCRTEDCLGCGLDHDSKVIHENPAKFESATVKERTVPEITYRYRISFRKEGTACYLSHLEMASAFKRAIKRAGLGIAYSLGMHPHPKISFSSALPVGMVSMAETMDITLDKDAECEGIKEALNGKLETGLNVYNVVRLNPPFRSIQSITSRSVFELTDTETGLQPSLDEVERFLGQTEGVEKLEHTKSDNQDTLRFECTFEGILSRLKKSLEGFALSGSRRLTKCGVILKSEEVPASS